MGTRSIVECKFEDKKQYWTKGQYSWKSYKETHVDVTAAAQGLLALPSIRRRREAKAECVAAILAETSSEWQISAQAALQCGITLTTIYTTLGHDAMLHGMNETQATILFIDWTQYHVLKDAVLSKCPSLEHIVVIGRPLVPLSTVGGPSETRPFPSAEEAHGLPKIGKAQSMSLEGLIDMGRKAPIELSAFAPQPDDVAFIMYTSGSTGLPKGVVLSHTNFVSVIASAIAQGVVTPSTEDVYIAYLPLAHILELVVETASICQGAAIGYGHPRTLTASSPFMHPSNPEGSDLMALRPTLMAAVPAILDLIKTGLTKKVKEMPGLKGKLVGDAIRKEQGLSAPKGSWP
jgi:long-chain acyl-CoA synthetase